MSGDAVTGAIVADLGDISERVDALEDVALEAPAGDAAEAAHAFDVELAALRAQNDALLARVDALAERDDSGLVAALAALGSRLDAVENVARATLDHVEDPPPDELPADDTPASVEAAQALEAPVVVAEVPVKEGRRFARPLFGK